MQKPESRFLNVFISGRMEALRVARSDLKEFLDPFCDVILAEEMPDPREPEVKSLEWARKCDVYVGVYGEQYGHEPPSITHKEFRKAKEHRKPLLLFVTEEDPSDQDQKAFFSEMREIATLHPFRDEADLRRQVLEMLKHEVSKLSGDFVRLLAEKKGLESKIAELDKRFTELREQASRAKKQESEMADRLREQTREALNKRLEIEHQAEKLDERVWLSVRAILTLAAKAEEDRHFEESVGFYNRLLGWSNPWLRDHALGEISRLYKRLKQWDSAAYRLRERIENLENLPGLVSVEEVGIYESKFLEALGFIEHFVENEDTVQRFWELEDPERSIEVSRRGEDLAKCYLKAAETEYEPEKTIAKLDLAKEYAEDPELLTDIQRAKADTYLQEARKCFRRGDYDDGWVACDEAWNRIRKLDSNDLLEDLIDVYLCAAQKHFAIGQIADGEKAIEQALSIGRESGNQKILIQTWTSASDLRYDTGIDNLKNGIQSVEAELECLRKSDSERFEDVRNTGKRLIEVTQCSIQEIRGKRSEWRS